MLFYARCVSLNALECRRIVVAVVTGAVELGSLQDLALWSWFKKLEEKQAREQI